MPTPGRANVLGILVSATDYAESTRCIMEAAKARRAFGVKAAALHALMESHRDPALAAALNHEEPRGPARAAISRAV